ncbi:MAG: pyridoxamine 5'-phosphate oxidase family protein [Hydrogenophaga sp.]|uniref:pyridoxamine 5'-phosphate oxidase family protein n=1 Tax=Hydrogenophaga sp. TaxID=1904254 RepID=UPI00261D4E28|nr:pyridoxamine 5'-phosphate oxidase family protein [Hydrogenophaga sp.]MDM7941978.1 pyridoxamine 5'-phosphate oxidase family protein [Hydrogenophaga sp.]
MPSAPAQALLSPDHLAMMDGGVSVIVSSCGADLTPSVMRAVGSHIGDGGRHITVFVCRSQSARLLGDVARSARLAAVFSQPSTHRTVQLKTRAARLREATDADVPALQRYLRGMETELTRIGFDAVYARAMLMHRLDDVVAIEFEPEQAFDQTPGPRAGQPITGAA